MIKNFLLMLVFIYLFVSFLYLKSALYLSKYYLVLVLAVLILIFFTYFNTVVFSQNDGGGFVVLKSILTMVLIVSIGLILLKSNLICYKSLINSVVLGLSLYAIVKFALVFLVFVNVIDVRFITLISSDMKPLGEIGISGFFRFVSANDFLFPFIYFLIEKSDYNNKYIKGIFLLDIALSFTRYAWLVFSILFIFRAVVIRKSYLKLIMSSFLIIFSLFYLNATTSFKIIDSIEHRLFVEGAGSSNEKYLQFHILGKEISTYPILGKGAGTYIEDYIRNSRLKFGYEVMWFSYAYQFGLPILFFLISFMFLPILCYILSNHSGRTRYLHFISFILFCLSGFTNPVMVSSLASILFLTYYGLKYDNNRSYA
ncbi:hypothetical protein L2744_11060 [Shewanella profunda]|uniref:hypothetical protein n=1 Tax=Shewanella profunda TaxID=254793 RepID=UPI0020107E26|nr:hypothetical protein [Shewanella profunda]MCL1090124.1 hypothetical protein [Shewanella profunda]